MIDQILVNIQPNFGITEETLAPFKSRPKKFYTDNYEARRLAIQGIELFEIPTANLGTPLEMLQTLGNPANILAYYIGLATLAETGLVKCNGAKIPYKILVTKPAAMEISHLVAAGHYSNAICVMRKKFKQGSTFALYDRVAKLFKESPETEYQFVASLAEFQKTRLYSDERAHFSEDLVTNEMQYLKALIQELYAWKTGSSAVWQFPDGRTMRRVKTRSTSPGREGLLYVTTEVFDKKGRKTYNCSCPSRVECKHIKGMKAGSR